MGCITSVSNLCSEAVDPDLLRGIEMRNISDPRFTSNCYTWLQEVAWALPLPHTGQRHQTGRLKCVSVVGRVTRSEQ